MESQEEQTDRAAGRRGQLGTFSGVFTPSVLTILGIILFMRLGYVVGGAGLKQALLIIFIANLISVLTSISLSAVATNLTVRGGGDYYLISRTLGLEFGGALGLVLFLAQSVSIAFYCIGFGEVLAGLIGGGSGTAQIVALLAIAGLFILAWQGTDWATRFQFLVMGILCLALLSFFIGSLRGWDPQVLRENWQAGGQGQGFWMLFAVFFPAVTGFTQGVSMSGDLRDPGKSLPLGTFLAVGVSILVYFSAALFFAGTLPEEVLFSDFNAMQKVAWLPLLITLGVFAATLSSAMASFLGAPRILQSLAADKIFPLLNPFARGIGPTGNPRRAVLLAALIAVLTVGLGNLNLIARVVAMFFLISYGLLNYATYFEARAASPSFRPRFKLFHRNASLVGALLCLLAMLAIDWKAGALAVTVLFIIHQYLHLTARQARWSDSRRSYYLQQVRENLLQASRELEHPRDWRPHILAFSDDRERRERLLLFSSWLSGKSGLTTLVRLLVGSGAQLSKKKQQAEDEFYEDISASAVAAFPLVVTAPDFVTGTSVLLQSFGVGPLRANTILLNRRSSYSQHFLTGADKLYGKVLRTALRLGYNLIIFDAEQSEWRKISDQSPEERTIDIWYARDANGSLMLLLGHLMKRHAFWDTARIRVLLPIQDNDPQATRQGMLEELERDRISAEVEAVEDDTAATIQSWSAQSSLVFLPVELKQGKLYDRSGSPVSSLCSQLPLVAMILAAQDIQLDADPESGVAGALATAEDAYAAAELRVRNAEKECAEARESFERSLQRVIDARRRDDIEAEELAEAFKELENAKEALDKATRYSAKAEAKADSELQELEQLRKQHHLGDPE